MTAHCSTLVQSKSVSTLFT